jgi:predicted DNA-binding transcriptional regulator AlpA
MRGKEQEDTVQDEFVTMREAVRRSTISRGHIYRLEALGKFPRRVKISANKIGFRRREFEAWLASRPYAPLSDALEAAL